MATPVLAGLTNASSRGQDSRYVLEQISKDRLSAVRWP